MTNTLFTICPPLLLVTPTSLFALPPAGGLRHGVLLNSNNVRPSIHAANPHAVYEFFHILARYFHETRGSLNFLTVHSCSQNLPLISCMYASNFQRRLTLVCLISVSGVKHLPALLAKNVSDDPPNFCTFSVEPLVIYNCALYN